MSFVCNSLKDSAPLLSHALKMNAVCVMPTDTIYGVIGSALESAVVERIYKIKNRTPDTPFIALIGNIRQLTLFTDREFFDSKKELLLELWKTPVTCVIPASGRCPAHLQKDGTIAVRMPSDAEGFADFLRALDMPVVAPSANMHGEAPYDDSERLVAEFSSQADYIVLNPRPKSLEPSTLIDLTGELKILRDGRGVVPKILLARS